MVEEMESAGLTLHREGDSLVVRGDLDLFEAPRFRDAAEAYLHASPEPNLDMTGVPFVDSAGLATLLYLSRQAAKERKTLRIQIGRGPRRVLKITGIDRCLIVDD
jgi:anti-anti-sigma factor